MDLNSMSISELRELRTKINYMMDAKGINSARQLAVGDGVMVDHKKLRGEVCKVVKVNRTKVVLDSRTMGKVSVPMSLISAI